MNTETKLGRPFGPITETIRKTCDKKNGAAMAEIREAIDRDSQHCAAMVNHCVQRGFIFKAGVRAHLRYFLNPEDRDAFALVAEKLHADECKAAKLAKQQRRREWYAARVAAMPKKEKVVKVKPAKQKKAKLLIQRAAKPQEVPAQIIWPEHVQVQRIPTPKDTRFTFEPPPGWRGEITRDWMDHRLQSASGAGA